MVMLPRFVSSLARFHDSMDTVSAVVGGTWVAVIPVGVDVMEPLFDSVFIVLSGCWVHPAESMSAVMSIPVIMIKRKDDIGIPVNCKTK
jgi:hypothetical protein